MIQGIFAIMCNLGRIEQSFNYHVENHFFVTQQQQLFPKREQKDSVIREI